MPYASGPDYRKSQLLLWVICYVHLRFLSALQTCFSDAWKPSAQQPCHPEYQWLLSVRSDQWTCWGCALSCTTQVVDEDVKYSWSQQWLLRNITRKQLPVRLWTLTLLAWWSRQFFQPCCSPPIQPVSPRSDYKDAMGELVKNLAEVIVKDTHSSLHNLRRNHLTVVGR